MENGEDKFRRELDLVRGPGYVLASYMRSGSIWLRSLLFDYEAQQSGKPLTQKRPDHIGRYSPFLGGVNFEHQLNLGRSAFSRQILKTHRPFDDYASITADKKVCLLFRKPEDALASAFVKRIQKGHQERSMSKSEWQAKQKEMIAEGPDQFCLGLSGAWIHHAKSYLNSNQPADQVAFLSYESLKESTEECLAQIVAFFDYDVSETAISKAVENRSFSRMKLSASSVKDSININKGQVGGSKDMLKSETVEKIAQKAGPIYDALKQRQSETLNIH